MRLAVLEFENLPVKEEERIALVRFRLRKTVPFDVDSAAVSYCIQPGNKVLAAVAPAETIAQYEAPFRAAGLHPGVVIPAALALLELLPATGSYLVAHRNSGALAVLVVGNGILTLTRSLEIGSADAQQSANAGKSATDPIDEISADLYSTRIYVEDQTGARPDRLYLAGFGAEAAHAAARLASELDVEVEIVAEENPGLAGYLRSLVPARTPSAGKTLAARKVAA
jgi:type IV pilus assembly protein PilM